MSAFHNPYKQVVHKYAFDIIGGEKYKIFEELIERISSQFSTKKDATDVVRLLIAAYESGYVKAVNDYGEQARKNGFAINIVPMTLPQNEVPNQTANNDT